MTQLIPLDTPATLTAAFYDGETAVDPGTVTVTVTRADGTAVVTAAATAGATTAPRTYILAAQTSMDILTAVWTGTNGGRKMRTTHEIVGGFILSLAEIRALKNLGDTNKYTTAELEAARAWFMDVVEENCNFSPVPRFAHAVLDGSGTSRLLIPGRGSPLRRLRYATVEGVAIAAADLADWYVSEGWVNSYGIGGVFTAGRQNVTIGYEYGEDEPDEVLRQAAKTAIRYRLLTNEAGNLPDRSISITNEFGNIQMSVPGLRRPTGLPEVDQVLLNARLPVLA